MSEPRYDAIVVGSGMGGLAFASIAAQLARARVLLLERHFKPGGYTHTFSRPGGYTWDVGVHYVGEVGAGTPVRALFDLVSQGRLEWAPMPSPYDVFAFPSFSFEVPAGADALIGALTRRFPAERAAIEQYIRDVRAVQRWHVGRTMAQALPRPLAALLQRTHPLARLSVAEYLESRCRDERLRAVLAAQWGTYALPPSQASFVVHALLVNHYLEGAWYPAGGSGAIARAILPAIEARGGGVMLNHEVQEIIVRDNTAVGVRVSARRGSRVTESTYEAPLIVSDVGSWSTYMRLIPESVAVPIRDELRVSSAGTSFVTLYVGLRCDPSVLGFRGENHWIFTGTDHDENYARRNDLLNGFVSGCYVSFPSQKDVHARAHTAEIIAFLDHDAVARWQEQPWRRRGAEYEQLKERMSAALLDSVNRRYPGFRDLVAFHELSTPITVQDFTGHRGGAPYGLPATVERALRPWPQIVSPIRNLLLTGGDACGFGVTGTMLNGVIAAARVVGPFGLARIFAAAHRRNAHGKGRQAAARRQSSVTAG